VLGSVSRCALDSPHWGILTLLINLATQSSRLPSASYQMKGAVSERLLLTFSRTLTNKTLSRSGWADRLIRRVFLVRKQCPEYHEFCRSLAQVRSTRELGEAIAVSGKKNPRQSWQLILFAQGRTPILVTALGRVVGSRSSAHKSDLSQTLDLSFTKFQNRNKQILSYSF
jgi:hypothetical protein